MMTATIVEPPAKPGCLGGSIENHAAAVAIWFMYYNFCRIHQALRVTPVMEAGLSDHVWTISELVALISN
jgi:hypothetical protein